MAADREGKAHLFEGQGTILFDPHTGSWGQTRAPLTHRHPWKPSLDWVEGTTPGWRERTLGIAVTGPDGRIYLVGGTGRPEKGDKKLGVLAALDIFDPEKGEWEHAASPRIARRALAAAFGPDGKLYVFGGCNGLSTGVAYTRRTSAGNETIEEGVAREEWAVATTEVFDPKTKTWSEVAPMPEPRMLHAAAPGADGRIYLIGGQVRWGAEGTTRVDVFDPATNTWSRGPSLRIARTGHTASTTGDGTIWVVGGYAEPPGMLDLPRLIRGEGGDGTDSVELLKTARGR